MTLFTVENTILELFSELTVFMMKLVDFIVYQFSWIGTELGVVLGLAVSIVVLLRIFGR